VGLNIGKRDVARAVDVLEREYETAEEAAQAVLEFAFELYEEKAKWTVVGQLLRSDGLVDPSTAEASKVSLGAFGTETQARNAASSLVVSTATGEMFRCWVLPIWQGTPAGFQKARKESKKTTGQGVTPADRLVHISQWTADNPGKSRDEYPGMPQLDPRGDCPICGSETEGDEE
jgi:hypothetical protein